MSKDLEYRLLEGKAAVYPGHSVTLAYLIVNAFPSLDAAKCRKADESFPAALSNSAITGAGRPVYAALDFLQRAFDQGIEAAIDHGDKVWLGETATAFGKYREAGQIQADSVKAKFKELFRTWPKTAPA